MIRERSLHPLVDRSVDRSGGLLGSESLLTNEAANRLESELLSRLRRIDGVLGEREVTPHTVLVVSGRFTLTPRALDRTDVPSVLFGLDFETVEPGVGSFLALFAKSGHVPARVVGTTLATLPIFDSRLTVPLEHEPSSVRLPEVGRRDRLRDAGAFGRVFAVIAPGSIRGSLVTVQLRPEVVIVAIGAAVVGQPVLKLGQLDHQLNPSLSAPSVHV